jgi:hypothetical protein
MTSKSHPPRLENKHPLRLKCINLIYFRCVAFLVVKVKYFEFLRMFLGKVNYHWLLWLWDGVQAKGEQGEGGGGGGGRKLKTAIILKHSETRNNSVWKEGRGWCGIWTLTPVSHNPLQLSSLLVLVSPSVTVSPSGEYPRTGDWSHRRLWMHSKSHFVSLYGFLLRVYIYIYGMENTWIWKQDRNRRIFVMNFDS